MSRRLLHMGNVFFAMACLSAAGITQDFSSITGVITDAETGEKLPYVNVFIANSTIGDASDSAGVYILERVPYGSYELVISHIGHELKVVPIQLNDAQLTVDISLNVKPIMGEEIQVSAQTPD
jgi:hypothetical protein